MNNKNEKYILVVDDKAENINLLSAIFKKYGYNFLSTQSGEESIKIINEKNNIGLVLMDVKMGGMTGIEAMQTIKKTTNIPIIAVTGFASESDRKNFINQGFDDFISKPIEIKLLMQKINKLL